MSTTGEGTAQGADPRKGKQEYVYTVLRQVIGQADTFKVVRDFTASDANGACAQAAEFLAATTEEPVRDVAFVAVLASRFEPKKPKIETTTRITFK